MRSNDKIPSNPQEVVKRKQSARFGLAVMPVRLLDSASSGVREEKAARRAVVNLNVLRLAAASVDEEAQRGACRELVVELTARLRRVTKATAALFATRGAVVVVDATRESEVDVFGQYRQRCVAIMHHDACARHPAIPFATSRRRRPP